jgi:hypothetical protein
MRELSTYRRQHIVLKGAFLLASLLILKTRENKSKIDSSTVVWPNISLYISDNIQNTKHLISKTKDLTLLQYTYVSSQLVIVMLL